MKGTSKNNKKLIASWKVKIGWSRKNVEADHSDRRVGRKPWKRSEEKGEFGEGIGEADRVWQNEEEIEDKRDKYGEWGTKEESEKQRVKNICPGRWVESKV